MDLDARSLETSGTTSRRQLVKTGALAVGAAAAATLLTDAGVSWRAYRCSVANIFLRAATLLGMRRPGWWHHRTWPRASR